MPAPQQTKLPPFFVMSDGMQIRVTAVDAGSNNTVANVTVANVSISVDPTTADTTDTTPVPLNYEGIFFGT